MVATAPTPSPEEDVPAELVVRRRAQAMQRLQIGGVGVAVILLVISLANVVTERAQEVEDTAVAEAKLKTPAPTGSAVADPLAEIGVVPSPEPATPTATPTGTGNDVPQAPRQSAPQTPAER